MANCSLASWQLYIARCSDGTLYTGITTDLDRRIRQHNLGHGARYTRGRGPIAIVYLEDFANRGAASRREGEIKRLPRVAKQKLLKVRT